MGAWGVGVLEDDTVLDALDSYEQALKEGQSFEAARAASLKAFGDHLADADDAPRVWLGLAEAQWRYTTVDDDVLGRVVAYAASGKDEELWSPADAPRRRAALRKFTEKIRFPNPKPRRRPRIVVRKPKFSRGDCLSVVLPDGRYGAALVLREDHADPEYGRNLIGTLEYRGENVPPAEVFARREWRRSRLGTPEIGWFYWWGFRSQAHRFRVIGRIDITAADPQESDTSSDWGLLGRA